MQGGQQVYSLVLMGTIGMLMLIGCIAIFISTYQKRILQDQKARAEKELEYQNRMIQLQLESQEQERKRMGADLHDSLGSLLWGAKLNATLLHRSMELNKTSTDSYHELIQILDESIEEVRRISWELTPEAFYYAGLAQSIKKLCSRLDGKGQVVTFTSVELSYLNDDKAFQVFRIVQELLNNSVKHSGASCITVVMSLNENILNMKVADNGSGFVQSTEVKGVGMWNINQRMKQLNGRMQIDHNKLEQGSIVEIEIPLSNWNSAINTNA